MCLTFSGTVKERSCFLCKMSQNFMVLSLDAEIRLLFSGSGNTEVTLSVWLIGKASFFSCKTESFSDTGIESLRSVSFTSL
jgi:hypothetical protein